MSTAQSVVKQSDSSDTIAMVVEIVFGLFGIMGMGWLYAGNLPISILAFVGYGIIIFIESWIVLGTFGFAACITIPLNLAIVVVSGVRARDYVRNTGAQGNLLYLIMGLILGAIVICGGLFAMVTLMGGLGAALEGV